MAVSINKRGKPVQLENSKEIIYNVHDKSLCAGRPCTIHNRTDHSMRKFPQHWRDDIGIMERCCSHGCCHPDPDNHWPQGDWRWIHGCDGCCA